MAINLFLFHNYLFCRYFRTWKDLRKHKLNASTETKQEEKKRSKCGICTWKNLNPTTSLEHKKSDFGLSLIHSSLHSALCSVSFFPAEELFWTSSPAMAVQEDHPYAHNLPDEPWDWEEISLHLLYSNIDQGPSKCDLFRSLPRSLSWSISRPIFLNFFFQGRGTANRRGGGGSTGSGGWGSRGRFHSWFLSCSNLSSENLLCTCSVLSSSRSLLLFDSKVRSFHGSVYWNVCWVRHLSTEEGGGPGELLQGGVSFVPLLRYHGHPDTGHCSCSHRHLYV